MNCIFTLTKADKPSLKAFIRANFHDRYILLNNKFFDWQYQHTPANKSGQYTFRVVKNKTQVMGFGGFIPLSLTIQRKQYQSAVLANLIIDKKYRGFGFGVFLVKDLVKDYPISFVNGYSESIQRAYQKLPGWTEMGNLSRLIGVFREEKARILAGKVGNFTPLLITKRKDRNFTTKKQFGKEIDALWRRVNKRYPITVTRSSTYLNWRYVDAPLMHYLLFEYREKTKTRAYCVVRLEKCFYEHMRFTIARLVDFISEASVEQKMIDALLNYLQSQRVDLVDYFSSATFHHQSLIKAGFVEAQHEPYRSIPLLFNPIDRSRKQINWIIHLDSHAHLNKTFLQNPLNWYVTKGDGDQDRANIPAKIHL